MIMTITATQVLAMPLPPELELWKVKLNTFNRISWKFVISGTLYQKELNYKLVLTSVKPSLSVTIFIHTRITILVRVLLWHHHSRQHGLVGHGVVHDRVVTIRGVHSGREGRDRGHVGDLGHWVHCHHWCHHGRAGSGLNNCIITISISL